MITKEWIDNINPAIMSATPLAANDAEAMENVAAKIQSFVQETGHLPTELQVVMEFCVPEENRLLQARQNADIAARKKSRLDYLSGSSRDEAVKGLQIRGDAARKSFVPEREYSQQEIDQMSDADAKRVLFGQEPLGLNQEGSRPNLHNPQNEVDRCYRDRILNYRGSSPVMRALKRELLDGSEQRDIAYRRDVIESQKNDRRKALEDLQKAGK